MVELVTPDPSDRLSPALPENVAPVTLNAIRCPACPSKDTPWSRPGPGTAIVRDTPVAVGWTNSGGPEANSVAATEPVCVEVGSNNAA